MCDSGILKSIKTGEGKGTRRYIIDSEITKSLPKPTTKICKSCKKELSIEEFYDNGYRRIFNKCKKCSTKAAHMRQIEKLRKKYGIPIKNCISCKDENRCKICTVEYKILNRIYNVHPENLRSYLIFIRGHKCEECKNIVWYGKQIPLDTHHIDGNKKNNILTNLKLLCKNCHALTDNYCFKNSLISKNKKGLNTIKNN